MFQYKVFNELKSNVRSWENWRFKGDKDDIFKPVRLEGTTFIVPPIFYISNKINPPA